MDILLSIRNEWALSIVFRRNKYDCREWGLGIFIGPITLVITNVRLLSEVTDAREERFNKIKSNLKEES